MYVQLISVKINTIMFENWKFMLYTTLLEHLLQTPLIASNRSGIWKHL